MPQASEAPIRLKIDLLEMAIAELRAARLVLDVPFLALSDQRTVGLVFQYCLEREMPHHHWLRWKDVNVQIDPALRQDNATGNAESLGRLYPEFVQAEASCSH
jgi:hypothetical protein